MNVATNNDYVDFDILEVARRCGVQIFDRAPRNGWWQARCPFCGDSNNLKHGHLYLHPETGSYKCQRLGCNKSGYTVGFYANFRRIDRKAAYKELLDIANGPLPRIVLNKNNIIHIAENPVAPLEKRHEIYSALLEMLTLYPIHRADLLKRGLPEEIIKLNGYKSFPIDAKERWKICDVLASRYDLSGIPGFFINKADRWDLSPYPSGYLIPVRSKDRSIQGCQFRVFPYNKEQHSGGKYIWLSSAGKEQGTKVNQWMHVAIPPGVEIKERIWLTEGPLKADIASYYMGVPFVATPGNSSIENVVFVLKNLGVKNVILAYDADQKINEKVREAVENLDKGISSVGMKVKPAAWPTRMVEDKLIPKGIDDACMERVKRSLPVSEDIFVTVTESKTRRVTVNTSGKQSGVTIEETVTRKCEVKGNTSFVQKIWRALGGNS